MVPETLKSTLRDNAKDVASNAEGRQTHTYCADHSCYDCNQTGELTKAAIHPLYRIYREEFL